jgi:RNA polymerase sigma factor (sigma-70 family)
MEPVRIPPFESFYEDQKDPVFAHLRRLLGQGAEDAFQETFLRALRAYPELRNGRHLRAWVFTIATRIAIDETRRRRPTAELPDESVLATEDGLPPHADLGPLTDDLPPKERAAVVLRYGFDLPYDEIAAALGSSEDAARQAASSGVRRLRERSKQP